MRRGWGARGTTFAIAAALCGLICLGSTPARANDLTVVPAGSVVSVSDPGVTLGVPADGRLNGYGFAGQVLGVATGHAMPGASGVEASSGQRLWVFGLRWKADVSTTSGANAVAADEATLAVPEVQATIVVDGTRIKVPVTQASIPNGEQAQAVGTAQDSGAQYFVASVPDSAADVTIELASGGYAQDFSLTRMAREGTQPAALYRSVTDWQSVEAVNAVKDLPAPWTDSDGPNSEGAADPYLHLHLDTADLSWFGPQGASQPADPGKAWLIPRLTDPYNANPAGSGLPIQFLTALTPNQLTLTAAGQAPIHAQQFPGGPDPKGGGLYYNGMFPEAAAFEVSDTFTTGTLTVDPGTQMVGQFGGVPAPIPITIASTTFDLSFPAASTAAPAVGAVDHPLSFDTAAATIGHSGSSTDRSSFPGLVLALVVVGFVVLGVTGWLVRRRLAPAAVAGQAQTAGPLRHPPSPPPPTGPAWTTPAPNPARTQSEPVSTPTEPAEQEAAPRVDPPTPAAAVSVTRTLLTPPTGLPKLEPGQSRSLVLGAPRAEGLPAAIGATVEEIYVFLSLHPGERFTADDLIQRLGSEGRPRQVSAETIGRYMGRLRDVLGTDIVPRGSYELLGVASDVAALDASLRAAGETSDPLAKAGHLATALSWVRGAPFSPLAKGEAFAWGPDDHAFCSRMAIQVHHAAAELADLALEARDPRLATWAAERGLKAEPSDQALMARLLRAGHQAGHFDVTWSQIESLLPKDEVRSPELDAIYQELRAKAVHL